MAKARKDLRGRALKPGEIQRKDDQRYMYSYTDPLGRRKFIYANDLTELREKEQKLQRDQLDGLDLYAHRARQPSMIPLIVISQLNTSLGTPQKTDTCTSMIILYVTTSE